MRRLFSSFAGGLPGAGLLVLRLTASLVLAARSLAAFKVQATLTASAWPAVQVVLAILLLAGLWTPVVGALLALLELAHLLEGADDPWFHLLLAAFGLAAALVGPGAWSIDA